MQDFLTNCANVLQKMCIRDSYDAVQALETSGPVVRVVGLTSPTGTLRPGDSGPKVLQLNRLLLFLNQWIPDVYKRQGVPCSRGR